MITDESPEQATGRATASGRQDEPLDNTLDNTLDIIIVGAGPVGLACGIAARRAGYEYLIIERGCLVNSIFHFPSDMTFFTTPERLEIGNHPLISSHDKPKRSEALDYYRSVARVEGLAVNTYEEVLSVEGRKGSFQVRTNTREGERLYRCRFVMVATGYYDNPNLLGIPGEDLSHVSHYYREAHPFAGRRVLVVGGRNSACETALDLYRHDVDVTLAHRGETLGKGIKYWVLPDIQNRIAAREIPALFRTTLREIRPRTVVLDREGEAVEEPFDQVFLLTGYHPDDWFLRRCGLQLDPQTLRVHLQEETLESRDVPGIFLAGSVSRGYETGMVFIENGRYDCEVIFRHLTSAHPPRVKEPGGDS